MNLGDVAAKSVPKMTLVSAPAAGGAIATRSFIPHRVHASIGVLAAVTAATACLQPGSPAAALARVPKDGRFLIEHPTGAAEVLLDLAPDGTLRGRRHGPHRPKALRRARLSRSGTVLTHLASSCVSTRLTLSRAHSRRGSPSPEDRTREAKDGEGKV